MRASRYAAPLIVAAVAAAYFALFVHYGILLEDERAWLVLPGDAVVVEDLGALELSLVGKTRGLLASICLEIRGFRRHLGKRVAVRSDA